MDERIMLKVTASEDSLALRTVSRGYTSPQRFILLRGNVEELERERVCVTKDIYSYAYLVVKYTHPLYCQKFSLAL